MSDQNSLIKFDDVHQAIDAFDNKIIQLNDLQQRFNALVRDINDSGGALGGDLGGFAESVLNELNGKLTNLSRYLTELKTSMSIVAASGQEEVQKSKQILENTTLE